MQTPTTPRQLPSMRTPAVRWAVLLLLPTLAAAYLLVQTQVNDEAAQKLEQQIQMLKARTDTVLQNAERQRLEPDMPQTFRAGFAPYTMRHQRVADFMQRLALLGAETPTTSFNETAFGDTELLAYMVRLNTTVPYSAWRDFVDDVLAEDADLALSSLRLSRSDASAPEVRAQAVFTFYMQSPQDNAP